MFRSAEFATLVVFAQGEGNVTEAITQALPYAAIGILFWLLMMRPDKKTTELAKMREGLKKNDRIVTVGGIFGTVVNVQKDSKEITIRVDEGNNTRLRVLRSSIAHVLGEGEEGGAAKEGDA